MPKEMIRKMEAGGVDNAYALLNAAGYREGDSEGDAKSKLSRYMKRKKLGRRHAKKFVRRGGY